MAWVAIQKSFSKFSKKKKLKIPAIKLSIQNKFILISSISIIILMTLVGYYMVIHDKNIIYKDMEKEGKILAETLSIPIINDIIYEKLGLVEEGGLIDNYLIEIASKKDIDLKYIMVVDNKNKIISHNDLREYGKILNDEISIKASRAIKTFTQAYKKGKEEIIDIAVPLYISEKKIGLLRLGISLNKLASIKKETIMRISQITLIFLILSFLGIVILSKRFIKPISILADAFEKAGRGNLDIKIDIHSHDEFEILGENFNEMIFKIKRSQEQLKETQEKLIQSEKMASIGILSSGIAHEINNPLGGIFNCLYMINKFKEDPEAIEKYSMLAQEGLERIQVIINRLLGYVRISEAKYKTDISEVIEDTLELLSYKISSNNITVRIKGEKDLPLFSCDPIALQQVFLNIILNALQAMPKGGELLISYHIEDNYLFIKFKDTGIGIAQKDLKKIFDPFFTTKKGSEGTGLGLWVCYHIIKKYNGEILVNSIENKGSEFIIKLPKEVSDEKVYSIS